MSEEKAILAGGCFWGVQDLIRKHAGVLGTRVGYSGGDVPNATYRNHGTHAEAIEIVFDPAKLSYRRLLEFFFQIHDPTTKNRQGNDRGTSYRSAIYYTSEAQRETAENTIDDVNASGLWPGKVVTEVEPAGPFWEAEPEHQDYLERYPDGYTCHFVRPDWKLPVRPGRDLLSEDLLERACLRLEGHLPRSFRRAFRWMRGPSAKWLRLPIGVLFMLGGLLWFLPILGAWMMPLGLLLLAQDIKLLHRPVGRAVLWLVDRWEGLEGPLQRLKRPFSLSWTLSRTFSSSLSFCFSTSCFTRALAMPSRSGRTFGLSNVPVMFTGIAASTSPLASPSAPGGAFSTVAVTW